MSAHTPGPWEWDAKVWDYDPEQDAPWLVSADGTRVLSGQIQCASEANARLIAAAPDLLAVLQELQESASYWSEYDVPLGIVDRINATIQKATGEKA